MTASHYLLYVRVICALFLCGTTHAYASEIDYSTRVWTDIQLMNPLTSDNKWGFLTNPQFRFIDRQDKLNVSIFYFGLFKQQSRDLNFAAGGFINESKPTESETQHELRLWEQLIWNPSGSDPVLLSSRSRVEERKKLDEEGVAYRFRERLNLSIPINSAPLLQVFSPYSMALVMADELFIQLNQPSWVTPHVISENRGSIGVSFSITKNSSFEMGYLNLLQVANPNKIGNVAYFMWRNQL